MIGLAYMAARLAEQRAGGSLWMQNFFDTSVDADIKGPLSRKEAKRKGYPTSLEYYAIIDRITRGGKP